MRYLYLLGSLPNISTGQVPETYTCPKKLKNLLAQEENDQTVRFRVNYRYRVQKGPEMNRIKCDNYIYGRNFKLEACSYSSDFVEIQR